MPRSMTGFARQEIQAPWGQLICELRTVNHRYLEPTLRLSEALRGMEPVLRDKLRKGLGRGKVELVLAFKPDDSEGLTTEFNQERATAIVAMAEKVSALMATPSPLSSLEVLKWPGVMQAKELDHAVLEAEALTLFGKTLTQLLENRQREGLELADLIEQRLVGIGKRVVTLREHLPELQSQQEEKIRTKLEALAVEVDEERLAQELVYLAQKSDVAEELDRLEAHLQEVRLTLKQNEPIGRRLDFLMQELNREANTLGSKSTASSTTQSAVDIKVLIEQMREQVQNIE